MQKSMAGTPQGGILSPLLANVYLNELDHAVKSFTEETPRGKGHWTYVRYADDFLLLTSGSEEEAKEKKRPAHPTDGGGAYIKVPQEAVQDVKAAITRRCGEKAPTDVSIRRRIRGVNAVLRGWAEYYKYATHTKKPFSEVDDHAWHNLSSWMARKHKCSRKKLFQKKGVSPASLEANGKRMVNIKSRGDAKWREPKEKPHPYFDGTAKRTEPTATYRFYENEATLNHRDLRWEVFQRDDFTCQECGTEVGWYDDGELHHLEYSGDPVDAETLCASCHAEKDPHRNV